MTGDNKMSNESQKRNHRLDNFAEEIQVCIFNGRMMMQSFSSLAMRLSYRQQELHFSDS